MACGVGEGCERAELAGAGTRAPLELVADGPESWKDSIVAAGGGLHRGKTGDQQAGLRVGRVPRVSPAATR